MCNTDTLFHNSWQASSVSKQTEITLNGWFNRRCHVVMEIGDNGTGVLVDIARKIFVPFFTTKEDGSGVGLVLTRQDVIAHGGFATHDDSEEAGAKFNLIF